MLNIKKLHENIKSCMNNIEGDADVVKEVEVEYAIYNKNMNSLLESENIEAYLSKYDEICQDNKGVLVCFNSENAQDLRSYVEEKEISFELKKHLASYMVPSRIVYRKSLPLVQSDQNQINKDQLKRELSES